QPDALVPARRGLLADVGLTNPDAASLILAHRPVRHAPAPPHQACGAGGRTQNPGQAASPQQRTRSVDPHARPQPHAAPNKLSCGAACPSSPAPPTRTPPHRAFATPHPKRQRTRTTDMSVAAATTSSILLLFREQRGGAPKLIRWQREIRDRLSASAKV